MKHAYEMPQHESGEDHMLRRVILEELQDLQLNPIKNVYVNFTSTDDSLPPWSLEKLRSWEIVIKIPRETEGIEVYENVNQSVPEHLLEKLGETSKIISEFEQSKQSKQSCWENRVLPENSG